MGYILYQFFIKDFILLFKLRSLCLIWSFYRRKLYIAGKKYTLREARTFKNVLLPSCIAKFINKNTPQSCSMFGRLVLCFVYIPYTRQCHFLYNMYINSSKEKSGINGTCRTYIQQDEIFIGACYFSWDNSANIV